MKADKKGRSVSGRFARLDHSRLSSPAYRALSPNARSLLTEMTMMENGKNNGELYLSVRDAADRMGVADHSAATAAFAELESMGFIACTRDAHFAVKSGDGSRARCWRLTWQSTPCLRIGPTSEYQDRRPDAGSRAAKRMDAGCRALKRYGGSISQNKIAGVDFATLKADRVADFATTGGMVGGESVRDSATHISKNGRKPPKPIVLDSATHTACQLEGATVPVSTTVGSPTVRTCDHCSKPFELTRPDRAHTRRFCSERCRKTAETIRLRQRKVANHDHHDGDNVVRLASGGR